MAQVTFSSQGIQQWLTAPTDEQRATMKESKRVNDLRSRADGFIERKARKEWNCYECRRTIVKKETYVEYISEAIPFHSGDRYCLSCVAKFEWLKKGWDAMQELKKSVAAKNTHRGIADCERMMDDERTTGSERRTLKWELTNLQRQIAERGDK